VNSFPRYEIPPSGKKIHGLVAAARPIITCVASGFLHNFRRIFGLLNVAVSDDRNLYRLFSPPR